MKKYIKELIIWFIQLFMFYIFPFFGGPTDGMGIVVVLIFSTFILSLLMGTLSELKAKYSHPLSVAVVFIPTVMLHYNESALIHSVWYLVISAVGVAVGSLIRLAVKKIKRT
ncbi:MAG: hypothetical protein IJB74_08705 [Clostridia bacterium]|nr:hypothetical protein [Clostridia bacterium]